MIYARVKATHKTKGTVYSNVCEIGVIPVIDVPPGAPMGIIEEPEIWEDDENIEADYYEDDIGQEEDEDE